MNKEQPAEVKKYLSKYNAGLWKLEFSGTKYFNNIVVVPAIHEYKNIINLLKSFAQNDNKYFNQTLVIFVVNNLKSSHEDVMSNNRKSLELLRDIIFNKSDGDLTDRIGSARLNVGLIDASSKGLELPEKDGGVGLARKIGMDLALTHFDYSNSEKKILICLDADCTVENNYLSAIVQSFNQSNIHAAYVDYEHIL
ncbi:MAG: glycosyltransferase family 2 protein, partial [Melioribacteraceae bacterium]